MKQRRRLRLIVENATCWLGAVTCIATLVNREWIEVAVRIDPDRQSGWLEWLMVALALVIAGTAGSLAHRERRHDAPRRTPRSVEGRHVLLQSSQPRSD
jgi:hypothetical protein